MSPTEGVCSSTSNFLLQQSSSPLLPVAIGLVTLYAIAKFLSEFEVIYSLRLLLEYLFTSIPRLDVELLPKPTGEACKSTDISSKRGFIQCYDPSTRQYLGQVPAMTADDVHKACAKAAAAQKEWAKTSFAERRKVLRTMQRYIVENVKEICTVSSHDSGKPLVDALLGEILTTCEKIRTINASGEIWLRRSYRTSGPMMIHKTAFVEYVPFGVIATIAPWNYPVHNYFNHIISGIFAGNAVVGKVSEHTSWSAIYFTRIVQAALVANGHSPELCQTITGFAEAGTALVQDSYVDKIIFTGSPGIGRKVMEAASKHLKPVILELGGKDAMVVMDDCKLSDIMPWVMRGCFQNCGQNCVGIERVLVYESLYDKFCSEAVERVKKLRQGVPTCDSEVDCASMVMDGQLDIIQALVDDAVKKGAKVLVGGKRNTSLKGQFYEPTIIAGVTPEMRIFKEELFGPVMSIIKVPDDDDAKCLELVNGTDFGLGSSVYCGDTKRGLKLGRQIRSGMLCINDFGSNYLVQSLPFGGVKESGFGRFAGIEGLRALCLERSIVVDRIPGVKTTIPPSIDYPINKEKGLPFGDSLVQLFYNESLIGKIKGILGLIKFG